MSAAFLILRNSALIAATLAALGPVRSVCAQDAPRQRDLALQTVDGWQIFITYFESRAGEDAPVVVLLPMEKGNRLVWKDFAAAANKEGYAVISVDPRKFGQSRAPGGLQAATGELRGADFANVIAQDLETVKEFIFEEHQAKKLNMRKMGIIGAGVSGPLAIGYAAYDWSKAPYADAPVFEARTPRGQDVRALVLLSPAPEAPGVPVAQSLNALREPTWGVSFLIGYAANDKADTATSKKIFEKVSAPAANKDRMYIEAYNARLKGTELLGKQLGVEKHILTFLDRHLKTIPEQWRNRQSRLKD